MCWARPGRGGARSPRTARSLPPSQARRAAARLDPARPPPAAGPATQSPRRAGPPSLPPVSILEAHHVFELRRARLQDVAIAERDHAVHHPRPDADRLARAQLHLAPPFTAVVLESHRPREQMDGFVLLPVVLEAESVSRGNVENLSYVALRMRPDELIAPRLLHPPRGVTHVTGNDLGCFRHAPTVRTGRRPDKEAKILPVGRRHEALQASHERADRFRQDHAAVALLPVFQDRHHRATDREPAAVERRHQPRLVALRWAEPDLRPPRLEVAERRARADLAVGVLPGQPHLEVVRLLGTEPQVRRAEGHDAMVQSEPLQRLLRVANQLFQGRVRVLRTLEPHQLDLVELVLPDDPLRVLAVAARLAAEARREGGVLQREPGALEDLVAMIVRYRHFCGGDEVVTGGRLPH